MTPRRLACAAVLASLANVPAAHAYEPYLRITTSGSPAATLHGAWEHDSKKAHLVLRGVTSQAAPTTFDAGITFPAVGKRTSRCPSFEFAITPTGYVASTLRADIAFSWRYRRAGGRWSPWITPMDHLGLDDGLRGGSAPAGGGGTTQSSSCRGAMQYDWRVHGTLDGEAVLAELAIDLEVRER